MKALAKYLSVTLSVLVVAAVLTGCAKPPTQELESAKAAVGEAVAAHADKYAKEELRALNDKMVQIEDELKQQEGKLFKNYDVAKQLIAQATTEAGTVKDTAMQRKEEAKVEAEAASQAASAAVEEAAAMLAKAPTGKGTKADIEMMKGDLAAVQGQLAEVSSLITGEDYYAAADKAKAISSRAAEISSEVQTAIDKAKGRRR